MEQDNNVPSGEPSVSSGIPAENKSTVAFIGGIILIIVLAILGWYLLRGQSATNVVPPPETTGAPETSLVADESDADAATAALSAQGTSDETAAIEADLNATDLNSLNDINQL